MASPLECSVCLDSFSMTAERQPMSLQCGHTMCRLCISKLPTKTCPLCRSVFTTSAPNFTLYDIMTAAANTSEALQEQTEKIKTITSKFTALQREIDGHEAVIKDAQEKSSAAKSEVQTLLALLQVTTQHIADTVVQQPPASHHPISPNALVCKLKPVCPDAHVFHDNIVLVASLDLQDILLRVGVSGSPKIYDFQGKKMCYQGTGNPTIVSCSVTWRNGTIALGELQSLVVKGEGFVMESVSVTGGCSGVMVVGDGTLTLHDCRFDGCAYGVALRDQGSVVASKLKLTNCFKCGFHVFGTSRVTVSDCQISGGCKGIYMAGESSMEGTRMDITGTTDAAVAVVANSKLKLTASRLVRNWGRYGCVGGNASLMLIGCIIDGEVLESDGAKVQIRPSSNVPQPRVEAGVVVGSHSGSSGLIQGIQNIRFMG